MFKQNAVVLSASQYDFVDEKTGRKLTGCTVQYILAEDLAPYADKEKALKGYKPLKASMPFETFSMLQDVPAVYELAIDVKPSSDGKMTASPVNLTFVRGLGQSANQTAYQAAAGTPRKTL